MAMSQRRAFSSRMLTRLTWYIIGTGSYNEDNDWVEGSISSKPIFGRVVAGNKFSQFEEGISLDNRDGGHRYKDFRCLYATNKYKLDIGDKVKFKDKFYNILQKSDEDVFGFSSYLLEESEGWTP